MSDADTETPVAPAPAPAAGSTRGAMRSGPTSRPKASTAR